MHKDTSTAIVLVVDHDFGSRQFYKKQLSTQGVNYDLETLGYAALRKLNYQHAVILLDMNLPDINGSFLIHKIRERYDFLATIPIIAATHTIDDKEVAVLPINAWMKKPLCSNLLRKTLEKYLKLKS